ncbi:MAG: hypothetical protein AB7P04_16140 [Bacteriovoracia bacterium]
MRTAGLSILLISLAILGCANKETIKRGRLSQNQAAMTASDFAGSWVGKGTGRSELGKAFGKRNLGRVSCEKLESLIHSKENRMHYELRAQCVDDSGVVFHFDNAGYLQIKEGEVLFHAAPTSEQESATLTVGKISAGGIEIDMSAPHRGFRGHTVNLKGTVAKASANKLKVDLVFEVDFFDLDFDIPFAQFSAEFDRTEAKSPSEKPKQP